MQFGHGLEYRSQDGRSTALRTLSERWSLVAAGTADERSTSRALAHQSRYRRASPPRNVRPKAGAMAVAVNPCNGQGRDLAVDLVEEEN